MKKGINLKSVLKKIRSGKFFSVKFYKRITGEIRYMNARYGVIKYLKGTGAPYSFKEYNLIPVYDIKKKAYRSIPIEGIIEFNGKKVRNPLRKDRKF